MKLPWTRLALLAAVVAAAAAGVFWLGPHDGSEAARYRVAKLERGPITAVVLTSGTLNAVATVQVSAQVSGQVKDIFADFNSPVKENQILARLDPATYQLRVDQARADLDAAQTAAAVARSRLAAHPAGARERAAVSRLESAQALVRRREALLRQAQADLERTVVRAPVDGTVVLRNVGAGQTVAASPQSPVLFAIARDLHDMQVEAAIGEADIGRLRVGQPATFTVEAFPRRSFSGEIVQIRKSPASARSAAIDAVAISVRNPDLALLPGMTANVRITIGRRDDALKVPNAALRFRPPGAAGPGAAAGPGTGRVWVLKGGSALPVELRLGLSDGTATELVSGPLAAGDDVIVGLAPGAAARDSSPQEKRPPGSE